MRRKEYIAGLGNHGEWSKASVARYANSTTFLGEEYVRLLSLALMHSRVHCQATRPASSNVHGPWIDDRSVSVAQDASPV